MFEVFAFSIIGTLIFGSSLIVYMKLLHIEMLIKHSKNNKQNGESNEQGK